MNTTYTTKPLGQDATDFAEKAADNASGAIRSTQNVANAAFDRLSDKVDTARDQAAPMINRMASQAELLPAAVPTPSRKPRRSCARRPCARRTPPWATSRTSPSSRC